MVRSASAKLPGAPGALSTEGWGCLSRSPLASAVEAQVEAIRSSRRSKLFNI